MGEVFRPDYKRILLIDDEPGIRKMMSLDLSADGYQVLTAEDGPSGLEVFEKERPNIVLTDVKMPGMDGLEVLRRIKAAVPETEVIVITGHGDMDTAVRALQLEASDFITKPIHDQALGVALKRAQERLGLRAELSAYTCGLEEKVREASQKLIEAERLAAIGQTVAQVAHSVKNMLAGLRGGVYLLQEGRKRGDERLGEQGLNMLERNLRQIKSFVTDMLSLSKPREPELEEFDPCQVIAEALEIMDLEAQAKVVELRTGALPEGLILRAEKRRILDTLVNLVSNAVDAAAEVSGGWVEVDLAESEGGVAILVRDNGPGLSPEAQANLGKGFFSTKGGAGTGLGLMVAHKTAREHGGRLECAPREGGGTVFRLILPGQESDPS